MKKFMTATDARKQLYDVIKKVQTPGFFVTLTLDGIPEAVVISFDEFEGLMETLEIMSDSELSRDLKEDIRKAKEGTLDVVDYDTFRKSLKV